MKKIMMLFSAALLLSSCSRYYVSSLESSTARKSEETGAFIFENDTLAVTYNFNGENAPISIEMYNKLNEPLYIDWQKSALIKGDKAVSFLGRTVSFKAGTSGYSMNFSNDKAFNDLTFYDAALKGSATLPEEISFIPPKSRISKTLLKLAEAHNYKSLADSVYKKSFISLNDRPGIWAKAATFSPQNSPLSFKSYLTVYTEQENKRKNFSLVQDFYLSGLIKSFVNPKSMTLLEQKPGNIFYNSESTGYGKAMTGVAIGAIVVVGAAAEASQPVSK
ncbi:hypothetical protein OQX61_16905 [Pedobacter sp. PLR]|uniref:hypothetical protein n=1 Tax=Pedobacter sp. PLR TaxID=2994465 RepID=UPI002247AF3D|nr:hypothetical protein [Pedobacter sp. PLR]MCX2452959.1 hypothetical protein [Pedobacter sp. PLR]